MGIRALTLAAALLSGQPPAPPLTERVEVVRVLIDARALDGGNRPVTGLAAADFRVRIGGKTARVESAEWIGATPPEAPTPAPRPAPPAQRPSGEGRLIVFLVQKSLQHGRIGGLMRTLVDSGPFFQTFTPHDRIAVLSFDSHLRVWLDFTDDRERVRQVLRHDILLGRLPALVASRAPSLLSRLPPERGRSFSSVEQALGGLADALRPLPGAKTVIVIGYGFGRASFSRDLSVATVALEDYERIRHALQDARATVFCLDITEADYHTLEVGLQTVAADTGGFFERMFHFPRQSFARLSAALSGHYVLFVERPALRRGTHDIDVALTRRKGRVLARRHLSVDEANDSTR
jgi:VWFA-related protein